MCVVFTSHCHCFKDKCVYIQLMFLQFNSLLTLMLRVLFFYNITAINFFFYIWPIDQVLVYKKNLISSGKFQSFRKLLNDIFMYHSLARPYICICFYHYNSCVLNNGWYCDLIYSWLYLFNVFTFNGLYLEKQINCDIIHPPFFFMLMILPCF